MKSKATRSRVKAYECLEIIRKRQAFANDVIDKVIDGCALAGPDKAFATRLVLGVVSMRGTLDFVIDKCLKSPDDIKPDIRDVLRISTYEILYLDKSPHAAVDQGVELAKHVQPRAAGVANAVLRKVVKADASFPFGNPAIDFGAFCLQAGFPEWLGGLLENELGEQEAKAFMHASNEPAPTYIALSNLRGDAAKALQELVDAGASLSPVEVGGMKVQGCLLLKDSTFVSSEAFKRLSEKGSLLVSDASAQLISQLACMAASKAASDSATPSSCLELCAGRGTKTVLLQNAMARLAGRQFEKYVAVDNVEFKAHLLDERARLFGANVNESLCADILDGDAMRSLGRFDLVFLDAPCSGLGTLRRHPEIRWRITPDIIEDDSRRDVALLAAAAKHVKEGGILAYSTCTVTSEEDELPVTAFLTSEEGAAFESVPINGSPFLRTKLAMGGHDAHFCAIFRCKGVI